MRIFFKAARFNGTFFVHSAGVFTRASIQMAKAMLQMQDLFSVTGVTEPRVAWRVGRGTVRHVNDPVLSS